MGESKPKSGLSFVGLALGVATVALVVMALLNVRQLRIYRQPTDTVLWQPTTAGLQAEARDATVSTNPVRVGDVLVAINGTPVSTPEGVTYRLFQAGIGHHLNYIVRRGSKLESLSVPVVASRPPLARYFFLEVVGLLYLAMGLFVLYRRQRAPQALRFFLFCLASFVLYCFHYTGKLNLFDHVVFWANETALLLAPCLLVHFALGFRIAGMGPRRALSRLTSALAVLIYLPAAVLGLAEVAFATGALWLPVSLSVTQSLLDRASYVLLAVYFLLAVALFARRGETRTAALQARVMSWGTAIAVAPFIALYVLPYVWGVDLPRFANLSVLSLALIPIAFSYAIWRHHLLEAEVVLRRGVVYTLATVAVLAVYLSVIGLAGILIHTRLPEWGWTGLLLAILVTALLFEPLKLWLQERVDRLFYRERYDYRRTLIEFGRQMNAHPELNSLLSLVLDRLSRTLSLERAAIFLTGEQGFELARQVGLPAPGDPLDLEFLNRRFLTADSVAERWYDEYPEGVAGELQLYYFLPCRLQGRTVAVLAMGRAAGGAFLSREDLELAETLAGYFAIALENARLYTTLRQKADEYQRLKDFNENIVESIQVGVIALNLESRIEGWNAHMQTLTGLSRAQAVGHLLPELLGEDFAREFAQAASAGVGTVSKLRLRAGDDEKVVNLAIAPLVTARMERVGQIVLLSDVTAEFEMEQRLIQADRLRSVGLLAAGVAHEVNTPLAVISSYTQMLAKQISREDPRANVLDTITRQTFRASEIVSNLLNFSRTGGARFRQVEVNDILRDTLALVEHPLRSANIHVIAALHPAPLTVLGDAGKLQQVFLNLILNARDAMPQGGTLHVGTGINSGQAWVTVSDSGMGIPPELHGRIFDPFFTTKAGRRPAAPGNASGLGSATMSTGTGLGLAVTYGIVQEHGGAIRVRSEAGSGAEFQVELPLSVPAPEVAEPVFA